MVGPNQNNMSGCSDMSIWVLLQRTSTTIFFINVWRKIIFDICQQPENCENRNDPDLVQAFLKKWWVESDFKAPNLTLSLRFKVSGCHYNSIYNNTSIS
jgi:hypothetical protein